MGNTIVEITFEKLLTKYEMYKQTAQQLYKVELNPNYNVIKHKYNKQEWIDIYNNIYD